MDIVDAVASSPPPGAPAAALGLATFLPWLGFLNRTDPGAFGPLVKEWMELWRPPGLPTPVPVSRPPEIPGAPLEIEAPSSFDRLLHAVMGRFTLGVSPASLGLAFADWAAHLSASPGKWQRLHEKAARKTLRLVNYAMSAAVDSGAAEPCIEPLSQDHRFSAAAWRTWPFNLIHQSFLLYQQWWHNATTGIGGVSAHHEQLVAFAARQLLDMVSPSNFIPTNPELLKATVGEAGLNLARGAMNFAQDFDRALGGKPPLGAEAFRPGVAVALAPGQVIYRNRLIELIQYSPVTADCFAEPMLIVPAWIMKYYILDLSPANSLVRYLVERGHTVFMISWRNPGVEDRDLGLDDYLRQGVLAALAAINGICPERRVEAVGYCLGGTLLAMAAAYLARDSRPSLNSVTLFAAQTDFTEAGELTLFIDDSQLNYLDDIMWDQGYLDTKQMAGAFQVLRSSDLIWSRMMRDYVLGQRAPMTDLMAWNADATRLPYRMHSEYLRRLFLDNELFEGRFPVEGEPVALADIRAPIFAVATEADHIAPWHSVHKIALLADTEVTFLLTSGGHNAGIVSEPGHPGRHFRCTTKPAGARYVDPDTWFRGTPAVAGSWWPVWAAWLEGKSSGRVPAPPMGAPRQGYVPLGPAPGTYVLES